MEQYGSLKADDRRRMGLRFTGGFLALAATVALLALLERIGLPAGLLRVITYAAVALAVVLPALAARTMTVHGFDLARQAVPGPATAVALIGLALAVAWVWPEAAGAVSAVATGLLIASLVLAPTWRRAGVPTMGDDVRQHGSGGAAVLAGVLAGLSALLATAALIGLAATMVVEAAGVAMPQAAGGVAIMVAVLSVAGGLGSASSAQLGAGAAALIVVLSAVLAFLSGGGEASGAQEMTAAMAQFFTLPPGEGLWAWLSIAGGFAVFPAVFARFAAAEQPAAARAGGLRAALGVALLGMTPLSLPWGTVALSESGVVGALFEAGAIAVTVAAATLTAVAGVRALSGRPYRSLVSHDLPASRKLVGVRLGLMLVLGLCAAATIGGAQPRALMAAALAVACAGLLPIAIFQVTRLPMRPWASALGMAAGVGWVVVQFALGTRLGLPVEAAGPLGAVIGTIVLVGAVMAWAIHRIAVMPPLPRGRSPAPEETPSPEGAATAGRSVAGGVPARSASTSVSA